MILFFDTETTGLPNFNERARHPSQPRIVQLAALLTTDTGRTVESHNMIVKPDGWTIPDEASAVHGITTEAALKVGKPAKFVAEILLQMMRDAQLVVAHNIQCNKFLTRIAMRRNDLVTDADDIWWKAMPCFCTMKATAQICKLPGKFSSYKWPKLSEAYKSIFGKDLEGAHDAMCDIQACKEIYFWLQTQKPEMDEAPM